MATLVVTKSYTYGSAKANLIFTYTYSVSNTNAQTTLTPTSLKVSTSESGSGDNLTVAKNKRFAAVSLGLDTTVTFNGTTLVDKKVSQDSGSVSISTTARNVAKTHAAQSKTLSMTVEGTTKSATITVPAKPSYAISYNGNPNSAASGVPSAQTKWYGETLPLSTTKPTRTNYVFKNWNTAAAGTGTAYASGASYTGNAALTLYAQWYAPYTVSYNANGGTGAPASQVKVYNTTLYLSTTVPTRTDFAFTGWNTSSAGSGASYASGGRYTANANATLYAQWRRTYRDPSVSVVSVQRVDATEHDPDEHGTSVAVTLTWSLFNTPSGTNHPTSVVVACNNVTETLTSLTGLTGTATAYLDAGCLSDQQYPVTVTLTDEGGASRSATAEGVVTTPYYPIDIRQGGMGVAIGGPSSENAFDVFMPVKVLPRSTSATETPLTINDGTDDMFTVGWDGTVDIGPTTVTGEDGGLKVHGSNLSTASQTASANLYALIAGMLDGGDTIRSYLRHVDLANGNQGVQVETCRVVNGSNVYNGVQMRIDPSGNRYVVLSDRAAWLSALGYTAPTALPLASGCVAYSAGQTPRYSRDGHVVNVCGAVSPASEVAAGGTVSIGTLPAGFRPAVDLTVLCQGSGNAVWLLTINTSGGMSASRYRNGTTNAAITTSTWLPFSVTFMTTTL